MEGGERKEGRGRREGGGEEMIYQGSDFAAAFALRCFFADMMMHCVPE